ncbi:MAG: ABC transporter substrate-binding protein [Bermanella sp.]
MPDQLNYTRPKPFSIKSLTGIITYVFMLIFAEPAISSTDQTLNKSLTVRHYQIQQRYTFGLKLLSLALSKSRHNYQLQSAQRQEVNERRGESMVINGSLDIQWLSTSSKREADMIAIKEPIYRGILGLRLILGRKDRAHELSNIQTKEQLSQYTGGHGTHWGDLPVYAANELPVKTHVDYNLIFKWLISNRIDYFHRGINEIWPEYERYSKDISIVNDVMLFYPLPVYFFVSKQRPELAKDIRNGLKVAINDGSYKQLFLKEFESTVIKSDLNERRLILLDNPNSKPLTAKDMEWWLPDSKLQYILKKNN